MGKGHILALRHVKPINIFSPKLARMIKSWTASDMQKCITGSVSAPEMTYIVSQKKTRHSTHVDNFVKY